MNTEIFYIPFSERRYNLRVDFNNSNCKDWIEFLEVAEYRATMVAGALNKNIKELTHKEILTAYIDLYRDENTN